MYWSKINVHSVNNFLSQQHDLGIETNWIKATQTLIGYEKNGAIRFRIRLPYYFNFDEVSKKTVEPPIFNIAFVLVKAGTASVGFFENGHLSNHKVFRAYMIRKKQGTSQIKYLKTKGKSRAGSRVRLQQTLVFFGGINQRLTEIAEENQLDRIGISCSKTLWPFLFGGEVKPPFEKDDDRLLRVPIHIPNGTYRYLLQTHEHLLTCRVLAAGDIVEQLTRIDSSKNKCDEETLEDW